VQFIFEPLPGAIYQRVKIGKFKTNKAKVKQEEKLDGCLGCFWCAMPWLKPV
jgi:hypothetical protein